MARKKTSLVGKKALPAGRNAGRVRVLVVQASGKRRLAWYDEWMQAQSNQTSPEGSGRVSSL